MRISDCEWLHATKHQTWDALTDPAVLQKCIPSCAQVTRLSANDYHVSLQPKVDGASTPYEGEIMFSEIDETYSCTLAFEGKGAASGMVIGTAQINLSDRENGTRLTYAVAACVGGKLGELGEKHVTAGAQRIIDKFLTALGANVAALPREPAPRPAEAPEPRGIRNPVMTWAVPVLVAVVLVGYHTFFR